MSRRKCNPLRTLTDAERTQLEHLARCSAEPAVVVSRARMLLTVASGADYQTAARSVGRKSGDAVSHLVRQFNTHALDALYPRHGGGPSVVYDTAKRERILQEVRRTPTPEHDGTATWSLTTLQKALRSAPDGLPDVSTYTIWCVLHQSGYSFQRSRTWCETGQAQRKRKGGTVVVTDPDATAKKN